MSLHRWVVLGVVVLASLTALGLITFGALRFLDQAQREHDRVECIRVQVQTQARGNAVMATMVLDATRTQAERAAAVAGWAQDQGRVVDQLGRC